MLSAGGVVDVGSPARSESREGIEQMTEPDDTHLNIPKARATSNVVALSPTETRIAGPRRRTRTCRTLIPLTYILTTQLRDWRCGQGVLGLCRHDIPDADRPVIAPMYQEPPQRYDRPCRRTAGFLGTMVVQVIG